MEWMSLINEGNEWKISIDYSMNELNGWLNKLNEWITEMVERAEWRRWFNKMIEWVWWIR